MPRSTAENARHAAEVRWSRTTPEERSKVTRKMRRDQAVKTIVADWPELTAEQVAKIRAVVAAPPVGGEAA
jgi:hypothetical protein